VRHTRLADTQAFRRPRNTALLEQRVQRHQKIEIETASWLCATPAADWPASARFGFHTRSSARETAQRIHRPRATALLVSTRLIGRIREPYLTPRFGQP
jgi:hypothetical protein